MIYRINKIRLLLQLLLKGIQDEDQLGPNLVERVYENALMIELELADLPAIQQHPLPVFYRERLVGDFKADIVVDGRLIIEAKAVRTLLPEHEVQLVNYLSIVRIDDGLLLNFGASVQIKRKFREYRPGDHQS